MANPTDPDEMQYYALYFIWIFAVCQSKRLEVYGIHGVQERAITYGTI